MVANSARRARTGGVLREALETSVIGASARSAEIHIEALSARSAIGACADNLGSQKAARRRHRWCQRSCAFLNFSGPRNNHVRGVLADADGLFSR